MFPTRVSCSLVVCWESVYLALGNDRDVNLSKSLCQTFGEMPVITSPPNDAGDGRFAVTFRSPLRPGGVGKIMEVETDSGG